MGKRPVGDCRPFFVEGGMEIFSPGWRNARNRSPHPVKRIRGGRSLQGVPIADAVRPIRTGRPVSGSGIAPVWRGCIQPWGVSAGILCG